MVANIQFKRFSKMVYNDFPSFKILGDAGDADESGVDEALEEPVSGDEEKHDDDNQGSIDGDLIDGSDAGSAVALADSPKEPPTNVSSGDEEEVAGTESDNGSHDSILTATTLELGKEQPPQPPSTDSDDENQRDSQVSSGWLGRAYNRESRRLKTEKKLKTVAQVGGLKNVYT